MVFGAWETAQVGEPLARERIAFDEPDFVIGDFVIGEDSRAGVFLDASGDEAVVAFGVGDRLTTRRLQCSTISATIKASSLVISLPDLSKPQIVIALSSAEDAARWLGRLTGTR